MIKYKRYMQLKIKSLSIFNYSEKKDWKEVHQMLRTYLSVEIMRIFFFLFFVFLQTQKLHIQDFSVITEHQIQRHSSSVLAITFTIRQLATGCLVKTFT